MVLSGLMVLCRAAGDAGAGGLSAATAFYAGHLRRFDARPAVEARGTSEAEALVELAKALGTRWRPRRGQNELVARRRRSGGAVDTIIGGIALSVLAFAVPSLGDRGCRARDRSGLGAVHLVEPIRLATRDGARGARAQPPAHSHGGRPRARPHAAPLGGARARSPSVRVLRAGSEGWGQAALGSSGTGLAWRAHDQGEPRDRVRPVQPRQVQRAPRRQRAGGAAAPVTSRADRRRLDEASGSHVRRARRRSGPVAPAHRRGRDAVGARWRCPRQRAARGPGHDAKTLTCRAHAWNLAHRRL